MPKVFISYSRKDSEIAKRLTGELEKNNLDFWVDWEGIPPTVDWMKKIERGIEESDAFLFLASPDSVKSEVCMEELAHAVKNGKRLIPLIVRDIKPEEGPREISHLNWIFFNKKDIFGDSLQKLLIAINTDYEWADVHSRLLVRALEWKDGKKDKSFLLRGKDLNDAETQLAINTSKNPHPTDLHREYILESRQAADRQKRWVTILVAFAAVAMLALGVYGLSEAKRANENEEREITAKNHAQVKEFESKINQLSALAVTKIDQNLNQALLLGVEAYRHTNENQANNYSSQDAISAIIQSNPGLIHVLTGHTDWVNTIAISPNGNYLASGSYDNSVILWNISNPAYPEKIKTLTGHTTSVDSVTFSSDGKTLASRSYNNLILWDASDPLDPKLLSQTSGNWSSSLIFTQDGNILLAVNNGLAVLLDITDRKSPVELISLENGDEDADVISIALSPDRKLLFASLYNGNILEWDITDPINPVLLFNLEGELPEDEVVIYANLLVVSPDGSTLASGNSDTTLTIWDISDPAIPNRLSRWSGHSLPATSLAFSSDGYTLFSSSDETKAPINLWDISNRNVPKKIRTLNGHSLTVTSVIYNQASGNLITGSRDGTIMIWNAIDPKSPIQLGVIYNIYSGFAFKPNSNLLAADSPEETLAIWDISNPAIPQQVKNLNISYRVVTFSPDGKLMASSDDDNLVTIWNTDDFVKLGTIDKDNGSINSIEFNADSKTLATLGENIIFWDITNPKKPISLADLTEQNNGITNLVFSLDGKFMASILDKNIVLWDISNPAKPSKLSTMKDHSNLVLSVAFSPNNHLLASASADKTIILWDLTDPLNPENINTISGHSDWVESVAFSPDGSMLASGSDDKQINLWNISNPMAPVLLSKLIGHTDLVIGVSFSPQTDLLASWGLDFKIILWDINPESWVQKACSISGGDLTIIEWKQFFPTEDYRSTCEPFKTEQVAQPTSGPLVITPTADEPASFLPVCETDQTASCELPASKKLDEWCDDNYNITYSAYNLPANTTFEVLTPGFSCVSEKANSKGEPRITCTGPLNQEFEVSFCNSTCSNTIEASDQCQAGYGLDTTQGCCAPLSTTTAGCVTETLILQVPCK